MQSPPAGSHSGPYFGGVDSEDVTAFVSHNPNDRWNLVGYVLKGFTNGSPDVGFGGQATYRF